MIQTLGAVWLDKPPTSMSGRGEYEGRPSRKQTCRRLSSVSLCSGRDTTSIIACNGLRRSQTVSDASDGLVTVSDGKVSSGSLWRDCGGMWRDCDETVTGL